MGLFGEEFEIKVKQPNVKKLVSKATNTDGTEVSAEKLLKSKKLSIYDRLAIIRENVLKVLGKQNDNIIVIRDKATFVEYIDNAIKSGKIAIDTETANSLDPVTCKLMGLCLYYPGGKQAYVPINHTDLQDNLLESQLTEVDCKEQLQRVNDSGILRIFHNGKFDYEVLKCTCGGIEVVPDWDTMVAARLLNENERAGLKYQYISKIDPEQEKYDIENLFEHIPYAYVDPDIFALYAATDSLMTYKLYELQAKELEKPEYDSHLDMTGTHELKGLRWLFHEVEMPIVQVTAEMELLGVAVDTELGDRLKVKYDAQLAVMDEEIDGLLVKLKPIIDDWRLSKRANEQSRIYVPKKSKMSTEKIETTYPLIDEEGKHYKLSKAKAVLLDEQINLASPAQLGILFYDILCVQEAGLPAEKIALLHEDSEAGEKARIEAQKNISRQTGKDDLKAIKEKLASYLPKLEEAWVDEEDLEEEAEEAVEKSEVEEEAFRYGMAAKIADLLLERRKLTKLITTYIDVIPTLATHWPDGRIRFHLNALGTDTGRYSSGGKIKYMENGESVEVSGINIQNIPSRGDGAICRTLFCAKTSAKLLEADLQGYFSVPETDEVETAQGFKYCHELASGDYILVDGHSELIKAILYDTASRNYRIEV